MRLKRKREVFTIIRHTRSGDTFIGVREHRSRAMEECADLVREAANLYGTASASVFRSTLILNGRALRPRKGEPKA